MITTVVVPIFLALLTAGVGYLSFFASTKANRKQAKAAAKAVDAAAFERAERIYLTAITSAREDLATTRAELLSARADLLATRTELTAARRDMRATRASNEALQRELVVVRARLAELEHPEGSERPAGWTEPGGPTGGRSGGDHP